MKLRLVFLMLLILSVGLWIVQCGPKPIAEQSILDTPENHYSRGMRAVDNGRFDVAEQEFKRATALAPDYAGGYVGMGLVAMSKNDYENAFKYVDKGLDKNDKFVDGYIAKGRIYVKQRKGDDWLEKAVKEYQKALKVDPKSEAAVFYTGKAYKSAYQFAEAAQAFSQVISMKGDFAKEANAEWELMQKIQRAAPGTKIGMKIALIPEIDRADLAVLFIEELKLPELLEKNVKKTYDTGFKPPEDPSAMSAEEKGESVPSDIVDHWAKNWIEDILKWGIMDLYPDGTFHPDEKITRGHYAMFIQNILVIVTHDESLASKYFGSPSRFPDVNPSHYAYNAICLSVDRGIMKTNTMDGAFNIKAPVSGADALLIIRDLQNALRMTF